MVIDSSALFAILQDEAEKRAFVTAIDAASSRVMSATTVVEAGLVALGTMGEPGVERLDALVSTLGITTAAFTGEQAELAMDAFRRYGKGRHPAHLNFGACCAYALAKANGQPLLFKGDDFRKPTLGGQSDGAHSHSIVPGGLLVIS